MEKNMDITEAIKKRHSVRSYLDKPIAEDIKIKLEEEIKDSNEKGGLNIQLVTDDEKAFDNFMAHYGKFKGVKNYIALIGEKSIDLDERAGYYGEKIVLFSQTLGLNTCWVALTFSKSSAKNKLDIKDNEKLVCVLALGYGENNGVPHKSKDVNAVCSNYDTAPEWFKSGIRLALLAPTAMNQQKFSFSFNSNKVNAKASAGFYSKVDLGIVKYHFEVGAGRDNFEWENQK